MIVELISFEFEKEKEIEKIRQTIYRQEKINLNEVFKEIDLNSDGFLDPSEVRNEDQIQYKSFFSWNYICKRMKYLRMKKNWKYWLKGLIMIKMGKFLFLTFLWDLPLSWKSNYDFFFSRNISFYHLPILLLNYGKKVRFRSRKYQRGVWTERDREIWK